MRIKVCGITTVRDALNIERLGADAIGVVLCSDSPRSVPLARARQIFAALSPATEKVCVTDTTNPTDICLLLTLKPDTLQLHGRVAVPSGAGVKVVRAVKPGDDIDPACDAILVDGSRGRGVAYDSSYVHAVMSRSSVPVILAGGLDPENVGSAIRALSPCSVDVSSGVEKSPGIKDMKKVKEFVRVCREAEA
jgi:phosphoribosylanthranilate isomerase